MRTIYVTSGGEEYLTARITSDHDITADAVQLALYPQGETIPEDDPAWVDPTDTDTDGDDLLAKLLVTEGDPGLYWFWRRLTDSPEIPAAPVADALGRPSVVRLA